MEIAEFLLARIAEDDETARRASDECARLDRDFEVADPGNWRRWSRPAASVASTGPVARFVDGQTPERVLAECDAKRRIVELAMGPINDLTWIAVGADTTDSGDTDVDQKVLRLLALPYAEHPDYDPAWSVLASA